MATIGKTDRASTIYTQKDDFWQKYRNGRPSPPTSFYKRIFDYHRKHGGIFGTIHDSGAGPGVHTARISEPFERVLVCDIAESNIDVARTYLRDLKDKPITFHAAKLDDASWVEPETVGLVFASTVMHLTDLDKAMDSFDHQLKPGGTLAIACLGYTAWHDKRLQDAWTGMFLKTVDEQWIKPRRDEIAATGKQPPKNALDVSASGYDAVPLPTTFLEEGALRYRINHPDGWSNYKVLISDENEAIVPLWSQIRNSDKIVEEAESEWEIEVDLAGLREIADSFPVWGDYSEWQDYWNEFEDILGGEKAEGVWPHVLLLATKKMQGRPQSRCEIEDKSCKKPDQGVNHR